MKGIGNFVKGKLVMLFRPFCSVCADFAY